MHVEAGSSLISEIEGTPGEPLLTSHSPAETDAMGAQFARRLRGGSVVALFGELGSGKTTFIRGICRALGAQDQVTSPTFTLIQEYSGKWPIYHFDFYRVEKPAESILLGCDEYFYGDGVCLIEWPDRILEDLPKERIEVHFEHCFDQDPGQRRTILIPD